MNDDITIIVIPPPCKRATAQRETDSSGLASPQNKAQSAAAHRAAATGDVLGVIIHVESQAHHTKREHRDRPAATPTQPTHARAPVMRSDITLPKMRFVRLSLALSLSLCLSLPLEPGCAFKEQVAAPDRDEDTDDAWPEEGLSHGGVDEGHRCAVATIMRVAVCPPASWVF